MAHLSQSKPALEKKWFWDFDYDAIDWQASYKTIIARILERSGEKEWQELIRYYGRDRIIEALQKDITFLPDYSIGEVSEYFAIPKEQMLCYTRKQSKPGHWI